MKKKNSLTVQDSVLPDLETIVKSLGLGYYPIEKYVGSNLKSGDLSEYIKYKEQLSIENDKLKKELSEEKSKNEAYSDTTDSPTGEESADNKLEDYSKLIKELRENIVNSKYSSTLSTLNDSLNAAKESAEKRYSDEITQIEREKKERERAIEYEYLQLMKNLTDYLESQGLSSLGISQSSIINANDKKISSLGLLEKEYSSRTEKSASDRSSEISDALNSYSTNLLKAQNERDSSLSDILLENYYGKKEELEDISKAAYNASLYALSPENRSFISSDAKKKYILSLKKYMTQSDWEKISMLLPK